jgi:hypothetical protein
VIEEESLTIDDLNRAERIFMINPVRKWCEVWLIS